jgi:hypothetical protein
VEHFVNQKGLPERALERAIWVLERKEVLQVRNQGQKIYHTYWRVISICVAGRKDYDIFFRLCTLVYSSVNSLGLANSSLNMEYGTVMSTIRHDDGSNSDVAIVFRLLRLSHVVRVIARPISASNAFGS